MRTVNRNWTAFKWTLAILLVSSCSKSYAYSFSLPIAEQQVPVVLNTSVTLGVGLRMQSRSANLIGKTDLNPNICNFPNQTCQGSFRTQIYPAQALVAAPGQYSLNHDNGDLNYARYEPIQGLAKITQDLSIVDGDFGFFGRWSSFYDEVNEHFTEYHPNILTPQNVNQVGRVAPSYPGQRVYGPGGVAYLSRTDPAVLKQAGAAIQALDSYFYGSFPIWGGHKATLKVGRQSINWGESTTLVPGSLNSANPINVNNFHRVGMQLEEIYIPLNQVLLSFEPIDYLSVTGFYQLEWKPTEAAAPGTFFSTVDAGTENAGGPFNLSFGQVVDDPYQLRTLADNPLARLSNSTATAIRGPDREPSTWGQYGVSLKYYFENLGNGTEIGLYSLRYSSRLPFVSVTAINAGCARAAGNSFGIDATNTADFFLKTCPDTPSLHLLDPGKATSDVLKLDSGTIFLEYPNKIYLHGISFNTTLGDFSVQGEAAWRPRDPQQVAVTDLEFEAAGPGLTNCMNPNSGAKGGGCYGTSAGLGTNAQGQQMLYGSSDFINAAGQNPYPDTINVLLGALPGISRSFPSYIASYRGHAIGDVLPNSYIPGYQRFSTVQLNLGATRVLGASDNWLGANQIQMITEFGAVLVPGLPRLDQLQIEGPATFLHASAGADGSGADGTRQACATDPTCSAGPDGLRFNPHQQDLSGYVDRFSWGYRVLSILHYDEILPRISLQPTVLLAHDVQGTSPGPAFNFVAGRKEADFILETRYGAAASLGLGYTWYWGGGEENLLADRDYAQCFIRYQF